jgi:hypothetical protein
MDVVAVEDGRKPLEERTIDLDLGVRRVDDTTDVVARTPEPQPSTPDALPLQPPPPPPLPQRQDNLLLYLDVDPDEKGR